MKAPQAPTAAAAVATHKAKEEAKVAPAQSQAPKAKAEPKPVQAQPKAQAQQAQPKAQPKAAKVEAKAQVKAKEPASASRKSAAKAKAPEKRAKPKAAEDSAEKRAKQIHIAQALAAIYQRAAGGSGEHAAMCLRTYNALVALRTALEAGSPLVNPSDFPPVDASNLKVVPTFAVAIKYLRALQSQPTPAPAPAAPTLAPTLAPTPAAAPASKPEPKPELAKVEAKPKAEPVKVEAKPSKSSEFDEFDPRNTGGLISNNVLEWELGQINAELADAKRKGLPLDLISERKKLVNIKLQALIFAVQNEELSVEKYMDSLQNQIAEEQKLAARLKAAGKPEWAQLALTRANIMKQELEAPEE